MLQYVIISWLALHGDTRVYKKCYEPKIWLDTFILVYITASPLNGLLYLYPS